MILKPTLLSLSLFLLLFISCSNDDNNEPKLPQTEAELRQGIERKWDISSASSDYASFEFKSDGTYHILKNDGSIYIGSYTINSDLKAIALDRFGTIVLEALDNSKLEFKLTLNESTTMQDIHCTPSADQYEMKILVAKDYERLYTYNMDGSGEQNIYTTTNEDEYIDEYEWVQDGTKIAYQISTTSSSKIYLVNPDGSEKQELQQDKSVKISPAGKMVVYDEDYNIYVCSIDGSNIKKLTDYQINGNSWAEEASWGPDGRTIIYISRTSTNNAYTHFIHNIGVDGSDKKTLVTSSKEIYDTKVSPNGKYISYILGNDIVVCDINGQNSKVIANAANLLGIDNSGWFYDPYRVTF